MKILMTLFLVLMVAAVPFAGTRTMSMSGQPMMASSHMQMDPSDGSCPMGGGAQTCPMEGTDMTGCTDGMDGMGGMMDGCSGNGGMMGLFAPSAWGFSIHVILASLGIF